MIFGELVSSYMANASLTALRNTEKFLTECSINRYHFDEFVFRSFDDSFTAFYVSTVPRGLAGSTSDLDLILVSEASTDRRTVLTNHLFYQGRRVGVKPINHLDVEEALELVTRAAGLPNTERLHTIDTCAERLPVKWADLERLVNGVSFVVGTPYLPKLPFVCEWALLDFLREYREQAMMVALASRADEVRAAHGYVVNALVAAMDVLMAACGRIQWNNKWTFYRWLRFKSEITDSTVLEGISILDALGDVARGKCSYSIQEALDRFEELSRYFDQVFAPLVPVQRSLIITGRAVQSHEFLRSAVSLSEAQRTAVVAAEILDVLINVSADDIVNLDPHIARVALPLLQLGLLEFTKLCVLDKDVKPPYAR